jgi:hypothetical protein
MIFHLGVQGVHALGQFGAFAFAQPMGLGLVFLVAEGAHEVEGRRHAAAVVLAEDEDVEAGARHGKA